jgi:Fe2+ transport system protein FeoA
MEMGLLVGTSVELVRFAPLGDPVEIKVRGYNLTLRKHEAEQILVKVTGNKKVTGDR